MATYREIFEKFPDGVTLHDADDGSIIEANQQFAEMLGYTRDELQDLGFKDLHVDKPPYSSNRAQEYIRKAAAEGPQTFEWLDETKHGGALPVEVNLRITTIEGEERVLAVVRDISDRKRRERELERKNEKLEEFASIVSHDLRNPLNVIQGRVEFVQREIDSKDLDTIERAADRTQQLIDDLLALSHETDATPDLESVSLENLADECWQNVPTSDASLTVETTIVIKADPRRLRQLLENLMRNAIDHGGTGVMVQIGELPGEPGFYVEDDGPGIPTDRRGHVFEPGFSTKASGTGYGLNLVRRVVQAHDWEISATNSSEGGARFEINGIR